MLTAVGWVLAAAAGGLAFRMRLRLRRVARAEHELRGAAAALSLAAASVARRPGGGPLAEAVEGQLDRFRAGLADLAPACGHGLVDRSLFQPVPVERAVSGAAAAWALAAPEGRRLRVEAGPGPLAPLPRGPAAQALGNLLANSFEHGRGDVRVRIAGGAGRVRIEVADEGGGPRRILPPGGFAVRPGPGRGLGLWIAAAAAERMGGGLRAGPGGSALEVGRDPR